MTPDRARIEDLFHDARQRAAAERAAFLDEACGGDGALRAEVDAMLAADAAAVEALRPPTGRDLQEWLARSDALIGQTIGGCVVKQRLGQGGMGLVYEAEQTDPQRNVAIKLLRGAMLNEESRARFQHEARVLANLRHPGIAQIHAAGTHGDDALPYFVMEHVPHARTLINAADGLDRRARLALFGEVCDAVHFGHVKGVVHRDLKPDNILVGDDGRPKVIDFGIAKITDPDLAGTRNLTQTGQVLGTLTYLSPEQLAGDPRLVDSRTDVYALGVVLYELLTGTLPYDLDGLDLLGVAQRIAERPPRMPAVGGDLDIVLGKALAKDPARRYASVAALRDDLERFLNGQPIEARPPSAAYQLSLFAKRHKGVVAAGAIAVLALVAGTIVSLVLAARADEKAALAAEQTGIAKRETKRAQEQEAIAKRETARARGMLLESQRVTSVVAGDLFERISYLPGSLEAREFLAQTLQKALDGLTLHAGDDPALGLVTAQTRLRLSEIYGLHGIPNLGETQRALDNVDAALKVLDTLPPTPERTRAMAIARTRAAALHGRLGDKKRGDEIAKKAREQLTALLTENENDPEVLVNLTLLETDAGERLAGRAPVKEHIACFRRAIRYGTLAVKADPKRALHHLLLARAQGLVAQRFVQIKAFREAAVGLRDARATLKRAEPLLTPAARHGPHALIDYQAGDWAYYQGRYPQALRQYESCVNHLRAMLVNEPRDRRAANNLSFALSRLAQTHVALGSRLHKHPLTAEKASGDATKKEALRHYELAVAATKEEVALAERLHQEDPGAYDRLRNLFDALNSHAMALINVSAWKESRTLFARADDIARELQKRAPDSTDGLLAEFSIAQRLNLYYSFRAVVEPDRIARGLLVEAIKQAKRARSILEGVRQRGALPPLLDQSIDKLGRSIAENEQNIARIDANANR